MKDLNQLAKEVHQANIKWWQDPTTGEPIERNKYELLALIISELAECLEGERKGCMDDKLPHRKMAEVELADAQIRILDFCAGFNVWIIRCVIGSPVPANKGDALFHMMLLATNAPNDPPFYLTMLLAQIKRYANQRCYDLEGAFAEKMAYNATREDHKHEARRIAGGKQF